MESTILVFCVLAIVATFFLKDVPMKQQYDETPAEMGAPIGKEENAAPLV